MVDICVLVEGAYPYVSGGVSSWLHALIEEQSAFSFAVVALSSRPDPERTLKYTLPANVMELRDLYIHDPRFVDAADAKPLSRDVMETLVQLHGELGPGMSCHSPRVLQWLGKSDLAGVTASDLLFSHETWKLLAQFHTAHAAQGSEPPFLDYFWTYRFTHLPVYSLLRAALPAARAYHAVSTGFNGFLGGLAKLRTGRPLLITEHGIYVREREIEIAQAPWLASQPRDPLDRERRLGFFQEWWLDMFRFMTRFAYDQADAIISITQTNQRYQSRDGADASRMLLIPNGIETSRFEGVRRPTPGPMVSSTAGGAPSERSATRFHVGFVGRVVPIKDVRTFIRAINIARQTIPNLSASVIGPFDEDPAYFQECLRLVEQLGLTDTLTFTGPADVGPYYRIVDVVVLTSLSEGQPLVILEANCAGLPVIASDVGACRELLEGGSADDQQIGPSGLLTPPSSPESTADAIIRLWRDALARQRMGEAGRERVTRYYRADQLREAYARLYDTYVNAQDAPMQGGHRDGRYRSATA